MDYPFNDSKWTVAVTMWIGSFLNPSLGLVRYFGQLEANVILISTKTNKGLEIQQYYFLLFLHVLFPINPYCYFDYYDDTRLPVVAKDF